MNIKLLPKSIQESLRSGQNISSFASCISQLVYNSLDANATSIAIRINLISHKIQVIDNGDGISKDNLKLIGEQYMTSKYYSVKDEKKTKTTYGYRGETIFSIRQLSFNLKITTQTKESKHAYSKTFNCGKPLEIEKTNRSSNGTTITIENFLHNNPVRQNYLDNDFILDELKNKLEKICLINPNTSFSLRNDINGEICFQIPKTKYVIKSCEYLFGASFSQNLRKIYYKNDNVTISGLIGLEAHTQNKFQYVYINKRSVINNKIFDLVNSILIKILKIPYNELDIKKEKYAVYIISVKCSVEAIDIIDYSLSIIEFKMWKKISDYIKVAIEKLLKKENLFNEKSGSSHNLVPIVDNEIKVTNLKNVIQSKKTFRKSSNIGQINLTKLNIKKERKIKDVTKKSEKLKSNKKKLSNTKSNEIEKSNDLNDINEITQDSNLGKHFLMDAFLKSTVINKNKIPTKKIEHDKKITKNLTDKYKSLHIKKKLEPHNNTKISNIYDNKNPKTKIVSDNLKTHTFLKPKNPCDVVSKTNTCESGKKFIMDAFLKSTVIYKTDYDLNSLCFTQSEKYSVVSKTKNTVALFKNTLIKKQSNTISIKKCLKIPSSNKLYKNIILKNTIENPEKYRKKQNLTNKLCEDTKKSKVNNKIRVAQNFKFNPQNIFHSNYNMLNNTIVCKKNKFIYPIYSSDSTFSHRSIVLYKNSPKMNTTLKNYFKINNLNHKIYISPKNYKYSNRNAYKAKKNPKYEIDERNITNTWESHTKNINKIKKNKNILEIEDKKRKHNSDKEKTGKKAKYNNDFVFKPNFQSNHVESNFIFKPNLHLAPTKFPNITDNPKSQEIPIQKINPIFITPYENVRKPFISPVYENKNIESDSSCLVITLDNSVPKNEIVLSKKNSAIDSNISDKDKNMLFDYSRSSIYNQNISKDLFSKNDMLSFNILNDKYKKENLETKKQQIENSKRSSFDINNFLEIVYSNETKNNDQISLNVQKNTENEAIKKSKTDIENVFNNRSNKLSKNINLNSKNGKLLKDKNNKTDIHKNHQTEISKLDKIIHNNENVLKISKSKEENLKINRLFQENVNLEKKETVTTFENLDKNDAKSPQNVEKTTTTNEWIKNKNIFINKRTGMSIFEKPNSENTFAITKRNYFIPKGMSPIMLVASKPSQELTPSSKDKLYETMAKNNCNDETKTVKWLKYFKDKDAKEFFGNLYDEMKHYESDIPNLNKKLTKSVREFKFTKDMFKNITVINQWDKKFIISTCSDFEEKNLILFDQHAVDERIRLEKLLKHYKINSRNIFKKIKCKSSFQVALSNTEYYMLKSGYVQKQFQNWGIYFHMEDKNCVNITHIPLFLQLKDDSYKTNIEESYIKQLLIFIIKEQDNILGTTGKINSNIPNSLINIIKTEACRGAIKFGDEIKIEKCEELIKNLSNCDLPFECAHGRPTLTMILNFNEIKTFEQVQTVNLKKIKLINK